jgi:hypothetical protein
MAGVSKGRNPNFLKTLVMDVRMNWRFAIVEGPKSRVPFGKDGFSIARKANQDSQDLLIFGLELRNFKAFL